jgi:SAM-dependent methyltransferase
MDENAIREAVKQYTFYHTIKLTEQIETPGWRKIIPVVAKTVDALRGLDLTGKRVLDVGCRDGLVCFEAEKQGAREVVGVDNCLSKGMVEFLIPFLKSRARALEANLFDLTAEAVGTFDVIVCSGLLYHLRYPVWGLKVLQGLLREDGYLIVETAIFVDENRYAMLFCPVGSESPYEPTSCTFFNLKGLTDSLASLGLVVTKVDRLVNTPPPPKGSGLPPQQCIDRVTLTCQFRPASIDRASAIYWDKTHDMHTPPVSEGAEPELPVGAQEQSDAGLPTPLQVARELLAGLRDSETGPATRERMGPLEVALGQAEAERAALEAALVRCQVEAAARDETLSQSEADRAARLEVIHRLDANLRRSEAERLAAQREAEAGRLTIGRLEADLRRSRRLPLAHAAVRAGRLVLRAWRRVRSSKQT